MLGATTTLSVTLVLCAYLILERALKWYRGDWHRGVSIFVSCVAGGALLYVASVSDGIVTLLTAPGGLFMGLVFPIIINKSKQQADSVLASDGGT